MTDRTNDRPMGSTDDDLDTDRDDALEDDRAGGWAGVPEALEDPIAGDETPGSQGEIEAGSEGDFGDRGS